MNWLSWLFSSAQFMPHGHCFLWQPATLWLNVGADGLIAASYFAIPLVLYDFYRRRRAEIPYAWVPLMFAAFILFCGATHVMEIFTVWDPVYRVEGAIKLLTGLVSLSTVFALLRIMPQIIHLQTPRQLQREVAQRTQELAEANARLRAEISARDFAEQRLRAADRRKDEFIATLAHELRNPLAPIRNAVRALESPEIDESGRQLSRAVIARQAQRMALLIDDLLDVARITSGRLQLKIARVDLRGLLAAAVETAMPLVNARRHQLDIRFECEELTVAVDELRLSQAVANLLTNAAKYTPDGGRIGLRVNVQNDALAISVTDNGIGFDAAAHAEMFEMFAQVHGRDVRSEMGLGIGLALVRALIGLHGGTIEASSRGSGLGSDFTIRLPGAVIVAGPPAPQPPPAVPATVSDLRARVLVTDDNHDSADSLALVLELAGFQVAVAYDGPEALELARTLNPDAAILDIGMPGMSGEEVARRLRAAAGSASPLLVAMTGWGQAADKLRTEAAGFDEHLTKPVDPAEVVLLLRRRLSDRIR